MCYYLYPTYPGKYVTLLLGMVLLKYKCIYFCTAVPILSDTLSKNIAGFMVLLFIICDRFLVEIQIYLDLRILLFLPLSAGIIFSFLRNCHSQNSWTNLHNTNSVHVLLFSMFSWFL